MSNVIPREQSHAFQRWELASFDKPQSPTPTPEPLLSAVEVVADEQQLEESPPAFQLPTAEDIERIHQEAQAEGHQEGYQQGFAEGLEAGRQEGLKTIQAEAQQIAAITANFAAALHELDQTVAEDVLELALEVARQMVGASLLVKPEYLIPIIREAMTALPLHHGTVLIHLHPSTIELVRTHFGEQLSHSGWRLIEDRDVQAGGCKLHVGNSEVDATVGNRWRRILEAIGAKPEWLEPGP